MLTKEIIEQRKSLWEAFSELWLDTELQNYDFENIVDLMIASKLPFNVLTDILELEVAPVVYKNLFSSVGVWDGFDKDWLFEKIVENLNRQERNFIYRNWVSSTAGKFLTTKIVREDWEKITKIYTSKLKEK